MKSLKSKALASRSNKAPPTSKPYVDLGISSSRSDELVSSSPKSSSKISSKKRKSNDTLPAISQKAGSAPPPSRPNELNGNGKQSSMGGAAAAAAVEKVIPSVLATLTTADPAMDDDVVVGDVLSTPTMQSIELSRGTHDGHQVMGTATVSFQSSSASLSGTPVSQAGMYSISLSSQRRHEERKKNKARDPSPPKESPPTKNLPHGSNLQKLAKMHLQNVVGPTLEDIPLERSEILGSISPQSQRNGNRSFKRFGSVHIDKDADDNNNRGNSFSQGVHSRSGNSGLSRNSSMLDTGTTPLRRKTHSSSEGGVMDSLVIRSVDSNTRIGEKSFMRVSVAHRMLIGKGSFGVVFQAMDRDTNHLIAVKEMVFDSSKRSPQLDPILRELDMLKKLNHPNIVRCLGEEYDDRALRIYMEYISGGTISSALKAFGPLTEKQTVLFARQLLDGVNYLHSENILHRDLKGDNLLIDTQGVLKIADFGAAQYIDDEEPKVTVGTPSFMAPEVISKSIYSKSADVWSAACCVVEMLTGNPPLSDLKNHYVIMMRVADGFSVDDIMPPKASMPAQAFIRRCFQIDPMKRPSAEDLLKDPWIVSPPEEPTVDGMLPVRDRFSIDQRYANRKKKISNLSDSIRNGGNNHNHNNHSPSHNNQHNRDEMPVSPLMGDITGMMNGRKASEGQSSLTPKAGESSGAAMLQHHRLSPMKDRSGRSPSPLPTVAATPEAQQSSLTELPPKSPALLSSSMSSTTMSKAYDNFNNTVGEYEKWMNLSGKTPSRNNSRTAGGSGSGGDYASEEDAYPPRRGSLMPATGPATQRNSNDAKTLESHGSDLGASMKPFGSTMALEREHSAGSYGSFNDREGSFSMHSRNSLMRVEPTGTSFGILKTPTSPQHFTLSQSTPYTPTPVPRFDRRPISGNIEGSVYDMTASSSIPRPHPLSPGTGIETGVGNNNNKNPESSLYYRSGDLTFYDLSYAPQPPPTATPASTRPFGKANGKKKL